MEPFRRALNLICALLLVGVGTTGLCYLLLYADSYALWMPISAGVGIFMGLYWLWAHFINAGPQQRN